METIQRTVVTIAMIMVGAVSVQADPAPLGYTDFLLVTDVHTNTNGGIIFFRAGMTFAGRVHTNGELAFAGAPVFDDSVTSASGVAWFYNNDLPVELDDDHNGDVDVPVFQRGFTRGVPPLPMPGHATDAQRAALGLEPTGVPPTGQEINQALGLGGGSGTPPNGIYLPSSAFTLTGGVYVQGSATQIGVTADTVGLRQTIRITQGPMAKTIVVDPGAGTTSVTVGANTTVYLGVPRGVLYVAGAIPDLRGPERVSGMPPAALIDGEHMTIASTGDIVIQRDLVLHHPAGGGVLGLFADGGDVRIGLGAQNEIQIQAFVIASGAQHVFMVDGYDAGSPHGACHFYGGCVESWFGAFGSSDLTGLPTHGYTRDFVHDARGVVPPYWPRLSPPMLSVPPRPFAPGLRLAVTNPVHGEWRVRCATIVAGPAELTVFDVTGRRVVTLWDGDRPAGVFDVTARQRPAPGLYLLRLESGGASASTRLVVLE